VALEAVALDAAVVSTLSLVGVEASVVSEEVKAVVLPVRDAVGRLNDCSVDESVVLVDSVGVAGAVGRLNDCSVVVAAVVSAPNVTVLYGVWIVTRVAVPVHPPLQHTISLCIA
jgi:hypothetical protein